jgi:hypothetical protein
MQERKASRESRYRRPHGNGYLASLVERYCRIEVKMSLRCPEDKGFACVQCVVRSGLADAQNWISAVLAPTERKLIFPGPCKTIGTVLLVPAIPCHIPRIFNLEDAWITSPARSVPRARKSAPDKYGRVIVVDLPVKEILRRRVHEQFPTR